MKIIMFPIKHCLLVIAVINFLMAQPTNTEVTLTQIRGKVVETGNNKKLEKVFVTLSESDLFALTEEDGFFLIEDVPVGLARLTFEIGGFETKELEVTVSHEGLDMSISLDRKESNKKKLKRLSGQKVRKRSSRSSTSALLDRKKNALVVQDAIGAEQISKSGDSDAGGAVRRVTGATLVGNLFIRGMGERYVTLLLGGSLVSSPDPDKRVVPLDIFPTSVIDSLVIQKTYSADKPGEFGSGSINIELKDYPEKRFFKASLSTGFEFDTLGQKYLSYDGTPLTF